MIKCSYRAVECNNTDRPRGIGAKEGNFCICCLMGQVIDLLAKVAEG